MARTERIGVVLVHGMGIQRRFEHLADTALKLRDGLVAASSKKEVVTLSARAGSSATLGAEQSSLAQDGGPHAEIVVRREDGSEQRLCLHEAWWGDIADPPGPRHQAGFYFWALAVWATATLKRPRHRKNFQHPAFPGKPSSIARLWAELWYTRIPLFVTGLLVLLLLSLVSLVLWPIRVLLYPGLFEPTSLAIRFMSDVKIFVQHKPVGVVPGDMLSGHERQMIRARVVRTIVDTAATNDYDRWYLVAHSLGSVVAFSALMATAEDLPRYLDEQRWNGLDRRYKCWRPVRSPKLGPERPPPPLPAWLPPGMTIDRALLLRRFAGLVTYGSPLDKFARLWPQLVAINISEDGALDGKAWLNIYDRTDPVCGSLEAFDNETANFKPTNLGYRSHCVPLWSHTQYLSSNGKTHFAASLATWMLEPRESLVAERTPGWSDDQRRRRIGSALFWLGMTIISSIVFALALRLVLNPMPAIQGLRAGVVGLVLMITDWRPLPWYLLQWLAEPRALPDGAGWPLGSLPDLAREAGAILIEALTAVLLCGAVGRLLQKWSSSNRS